MNLRVLVTGAGGDSAQGVIRALRKSSSNYFIGSVCINKNSPGLFLSDMFEIAPPLINEEEYIAFLIDFIQRHSIDILIPTIDSELSLISKSREIIEDCCTVKVIVGSSESINICSDKLLSSAYLSSIGLGQLETMTIEDRGKIRDKISSGVKIIMKPKNGGGSKGIRILDQTNLSDDYWLNDNSIYQDFEHFSKEITAVVMKNGKQVVATAVFERILEGGRTTWCKRIESDAFDSMLRHVAEGLDIPYLNVQFGLVDGQAHIFDLNPRFSGSTGAFSKVFNGPHLLTQKYHQGFMPEFNCSKEYFESVRYYDDLFYNSHEK